MTITTTNMNLILPEPEVTIGPDWAEELNEALETVDAHDHSTGKGVKITPTGIEINSDLAFNSNAATTVSYVELIDSVVTLATPAVVYRVDEDLYYNTSIGTPVQITAGGVVNAPGSGVIAAKVVSVYPYTVISGDAQKVIIVDTTSARTINMPPATTTMFFMIKDGNQLAQTNVITVSPDGTDTIDGSNSNFLLDWNNASVGFVSDGVTKWYVV